MRKKLACLFLIFTGLVNAYSQNQYGFTNYTQEDGLSSGTIRNILKDTTGYLWLTSEEGISRFDGYNFKVFRHNPDDSTSLPDNIAWSAINSGTGDMYYFTGQGVRRYDPLTLSFTKHFPFGDTVKTLKEFAFQIDNDSYFLLSNYHLIFVSRTKCEFFPLPVGAKGSAFGMIAGEANQFILYQSNNNVSFLFDLSKKAFQKINCYDPDGKIDSTILNYVFLKSENNFLAISKHYLFRYNKSTHNFNAVLTLNVLNNLEAISNRVQIESDKFLFLPTNQGKLYKLNIQDGKEQVFQLNKKIPEEELKDRFMNFTIPGDNGWFWIQSRGMGIFHFNSNTDEWEQFIHEPGNPNSLASNTVESLFTDENGVVWVSCFGQGLVKMEPESPILFHTTPAVNKNQIVSGGFNENVRTFLETDDGYWIGTLKGLYAFNTSTKQFSDLNHLFGNGNSGDMQVGTLAIDSFGNKWIGTWSGKLFVISGKQNKWISIQLPIPEGLIDVGIRYRDLYCDSKNTMWIGTYNNGTYSINVQDLDFDDPANTKIKSFIHSAADTSSVSANMIFSFIEDGDGNIWAGSDNGLNRYNSANGKWIKYFNIAGDEKSLHNNNIRSFAIDKSGTLWIGTNGGGLNRYNKTENNFSHFTMENGLPNDAIYTLLCDNNGMLWLGTNYGLCRFNPTDFTCRNFTLKDGIQNYEYNTEAALKLKDGTLLIGGVSGYNIINPNKIASEKSYAPVVVISSVKIFDHEKSIGKNLLQLTYKENMIAFEFAALSYFRNQDNRYAYMMVGVDPNWIYCGSRRYVSYSNLEPGDYVFKVKACNSDGIWNETGTQLNISISPPWWRTWTAEIIFSLLVIGSVVSYLRYRTRSLLVRQKELEAKVAERTEQLLESKEQLVKNEKAAAFGVMASKVSHEILNPLNFVNNFSDLSQELVSEIIDAKTPEEKKENAETLISNLQKISEHGKRATNIVRQLQEHSTKGTAMEFLESKE